MKTFKLYLYKLLAVFMIVSVLLPPVSSVRAEESESLSDAISTSFSNDFTGLPNPVAIVSYSAATRSLKVNNQSIFTVSAPDREYTVENVGGVEGCYLAVSCIKYRATTAGEVRAEYQDKLKDPQELSALPADSMPVYLNTNSNWSDEYYLTAKNEWRSGFENGTHIAVRHIKEGEKATFTLPEARENDVYSLRIYAYSSEIFEPDKFAFDFYNILIDTDGIYPDIGADPEKNLSFPILDVLEIGEMDTAEATYTPPYRLLSVLPLTQAYLAAPGQSFTLTNTGAAPGYTLSVSVGICVPMPADQIHKQYVNGENTMIWIEALPTDDRIAYFCVNTSANNFYLTEEGVWKNGFLNENEDKALHLEAGGSVTFTLPDAEEGALYRIAVKTGASTHLYSVLSDSNASVKEPPKEDADLDISGFTDVSQDAYYAEGVAWAVKNAITTGTTETTFSPDSTCTNAQIITMLWRAKGSPAPRSTTENPFTDVSETDFFYQAALWAYESDLVADGSFNGDLPCTRALTVTYLWKLAGMPEAPAADFTDVDNSAQYALAVAWAVSEGITTGTSDGTFSPYDTCTRAQIVTFLYRALSD